MSKVGFDDLSADSPSNKYITKYYNDSRTDGIGNSIIYTYGKIGDATKEIYRGGGRYLDSTNNYAS